MERPHHPSLVVPRGAGAGTRGTLASEDQDRHRHEGRKARAAMTRQDRTGVNCFLEAALGGTLPDTSPATTRSISHPGVF